MDAIGWLMNSIGLGDLDPEEIKQAVESAKILIPKIASEFERMNNSLARLELKLDLLIDGSTPATKLELEMVTKHNDPRRASFT